MLVEFIAFILGLYMWIRPEHMTRREARMFPDKVRRTRNLGILVAVVMGLLVLVDIIQYTL